MNESNNLQTTNVPTEAPDFSITDTLKKAWELVGGSKATFWGAVGLMFLTTVGIGIIQGVLLGFDEKAQEGVLSIVFSLLGTVVSYVLSTGIMIMGVRRARGQVIRAPMVFEHFSKVVPIVLVYLLMVIAIMIGTLLLIIPGIYLAVAYIFAPLLVVDKGMKPWAAMEASRKLVTTRWFSYFGVFLLGGIIFTISVIPFFLGAIWTLPWGYNLYGTLYTEAFDA